ncbi:MAG: hypothetical protein D6788_11885 [Planctomycetota bacterium]|nr:MAG: hypothetical protein D6788_11885 [Planctomycetota bacterium]
MPVPPDSASTEMPGKRTNATLEADLSALLADRFPGMEITVGHSERWNAPCVTFRWAGFAELLPEERFQRLATVIPEPFRRERMAGYVWLELAPEETVDAFLKLPRSEDVVERAGGIYADLSRSGFFDALEEALAPSPDKRCGGDFTASVRILEEKGFAPERIVDARLLFIHHGVYCDCQVLQTIRSELAKRYAGVA